MFFFYQILFIIIILLSPLIIIFRLIKNKEDKKRFLEKFTINLKERKTGNLIWFHAASVGEFLSIVPLIKELEKNKNIKNILVTTSTLSSSEILEILNLKRQFINFFLSILYTLHQNLSIIGNPK